jgi:hypothetical protein
MPSATERVMAKRHLTTVDEVINALGGTHVVAELTGRVYGAVWYWRKAGNFPSTLYVCMQQRLRRRGLSAPHSLWLQEAVLDRRAA